LLCLEYGNVAFLSPIFVWWQPDTPRSGLCLPLELDMIDILRVAIIDRASHRAYGCDLTRVS
jgi:hypothetical protein